MKIVQLNLNHCATAQDLLKQYVRETQVDIAIVCEQYRDAGRKPILIAGDFNAWTVECWSGAVKEQIRGVKYYWKHSGSEIWF